MNIVIFRCCMPLTLAEGHFFRGFVKLCGRSSFRRMDVGHLRTVPSEYFGLTALKVRLSERWHVQNTQGKDGKFYDNVKFPRDFERKEDRSESPFDNGTWSPIFHGPKGMPEKKGYPVDAIPNGALIDHRSFKKRP